MLLINLALVVARRRHRPPRRRADAGAATLFFVLLLSLLIALFDRFRATATRWSTARPSGPPSAPASSHAATARRPTRSTPERMHNCSEWLACFTTCLEVVRPSVDRSTRTEHGGIIRRQPRSRPTVDEGSPRWRPAPVASRLQEVALG